MQYSGTLPYTKTEIVSGKYVIGLFAQIAVLVVAGVAQAVKTLIVGEFILGDFVAMMLLILTISTLTFSISLPFIFKLGVEKGRAAYYMMIGFVCGASVLVSSLFRKQLEAEIESNLIVIVVAIVGIAIYIFPFKINRCNLHLVV